jgi:hypothetical protein
MVNVVFALLILALLTIGVISGGTSETTTATPSVNNSDGGTLDMNMNTVPPITQHVTNNPATWPQGDRIWDCCRAIAYAEGYNLPNAVPYLLNNPGDISDGADVFGSETHSGSHVTHFPDAVTGWSWLYAKLQHAASGQSSVYDPSMSWREIGVKWAGNAATWSTNVATRLGVDVDSSLGDYVNG